MKLCEFSECSFQNWYPKFRHCSILSYCEPLPEDVIEYLKTDNVTVPTEAVLEHKHSNDDYDTEDSSSINWELADDDDQCEIVAPSFPEFSSKVKTLIENLGGSVFVKLNWSAPTDAAWIATNNSLKCTNLQDLYLLLKSSYKITEDLSRDYRHQGNKYFLVLKKWKNIHPASEFRCFIKDDELVAVSQRNKFDYHEHIYLHKVDIIRDLKEFYFSKIKSYFTLSKFCMDVARSSSGVIKIIDIQPLLHSTDTYLFTHEEINSLEFSEELSPEFRFIAEETGIQPNMDNHFGIPRDLIDLPEENRNDIIRFLQERAREDSM